MSITGLTPLVNTNTFGQWKDRTNEIIESLEDVVTIGDAEQNVGNIVITGNLTTSNSVITDTISPRDNAIDTVTLTSFTAIQGNMSIENTAGGVSKISFINDGVPSWDITTNVDHTELKIVKGNLELTVDDGTATLTGANIKIDDAILPDTITSNIQGDVDGQVSDISNHDTNDLSEGTTNQYFTTARARASVGASTGVSYDSGTGRFSIGQAVATTSNVTFNSVTGGDFKTGNWEIDTDGSGNLCFYYNGNLKFRMNTSGQFVAEGDVTANGGI